MQIDPDIRLHPEFRSRLLPLLAAADHRALAGEVERLRAENAAYREGVSAPDVCHRFQRISENIKRHIINREDITAQAIRALITGEHLFIFSAAGVAKSLLARQLFAYIRNSSVFAIQFSPDTTPDDLFGGYDLEAFKRGHIFHNIEGSILTHNFAFLDEFMDAGDKILRTLLGVLLERRFINGHQEEAALLHTAFATANYVRRNETTMALLDRFLYKSFISPRKDMFTLLQIDKVYNENAGQVHAPGEELQIDMRELHYLRDYVQNRLPDRRIEIAPEIEYLKNLIAASFEEEMKKYRNNYYLSPRTITKSNDLLKANALLRGSDEVNLADVQDLQYLFAVLHEPLGEDSNLCSEDLFKRVAEKRIRYFNSVREELIPLLYLIDFLHNAERDRQLLQTPLAFLRRSTKRSLLGDLWHRLRGAFGEKESNSVAENRDKIVTFLRNYKSQYNEIREFRQRTEDFAKRVFSPSD
jgi:MoxR-like ATPase